MVCDGVEQVLHNASCYASRRALYEARRLVVEDVLVPGSSSCASSAHASEFVPAPRSDARHSSGVSDLVEESSSGDEPLQLKRAKVPRRRPVNVVCESDSE